MLVSSCGDRVEGSCIGMVNIAGTWVWMLHCTCLDLRSCGWSGLSWSASVLTLLLDSSQREL